MFWVFYDPRDWGTADLTIQWSRTIGFPLGGLIALLTDEFIEARVDRAFVGADGVFSNKNCFRWHGIESVAAASSLIILAKKHFRSTFDRARWRNYQNQHINLGFYE